jgi:hypothetical protein
VATITGITRAAQNGFMQDHQTNDEPGNGRADTLKSTPQPEGPPAPAQCPPGPEQRIQEAVAFALGEIFSAVEELAWAACEARLQFFEERIAALEADYRRREDAAHRARILDAVCYAAALREAAQ